MVYCPVLFRCSECAMELPSLELLESHIWSRHLRNFPFRCSICGFPAIAHTSLEAHFKEAHSRDRPVEFQRKMVDEVRLRNIVANSIVVPVYEAAPRNISHDSHREDQECDLDIKSLDADSRKSASNSVVKIERGIERITNVADDGDSLQLDMINDSSSSDGVPFLEQQISTEGEIIGYVEMFVPEEGQYRKVSVLRNIDDPSDIGIVDNSSVHNGQHVTKGTQMVQLDDNETTYFYEGLENGTVVVDRASYDFQQNEGNNVYIEEASPSNLKSNDDINMRLRKQRRIDVIVDKIACKTNGPSRRSMTVYECEDCGKIVRYPSKIKEHRRSHSGLKPYECPECGQRFVQKGGLTCHMRLHTGERPYTCTWDCGKSFHSNSALKMHEKSHSGERPHSCEFCGKRFSKRSHCRRHESSVHPGEVARRATQRVGLAAAGADEDRLREVVNSVIEEVRIERSLRKEFDLKLR